MNEVSRKLFPVVLMLLIAPAAWATCPTAPSDYCLGGLGCWWEYTPDPSCVSVYGSPTPGNDSMCYSRPSVVPAVGWADASYTFTIDGSGDENFDYWSAETSVDLIDPNDSGGNGVEIYAGVHVGGVPQWQFVAGISGAQGDFGCETVWGSFSASPGDTVTVVVYSFRSNSNAAVEASHPRIYSTQY